MENRNLTAHFTLAEMVTTQQRGLDNTPSPEIEAKLTNLCEFLEDVHALVGPMHVNSGYRSVAVNAAVGGQPTSQHCKGEAADLVTLKIGLKEFAQKLLDSKLPYDQLIFEHGTWVHLSFTKDRPPRRQALMIGKWTQGRYEAIDFAKL